jgi:hypothetical protein
LGSGDGGSIEPDVSAHEGKMRLRVLESHVVVGARRRVGAVRRAFMIARATHKGTGFFMLGAPSDDLAAGGTE